MNNTIVRIKDLFYDVAIREDGLLRKISETGIFHMPELAYVYQCGKELCIRSHEIFDTVDYKWVREKHQETGEFTDLVFENKDTKNKFPQYAIEFKMDDTYHAYINDMKKLQKLETKSTKLFCAIKWVYHHQIQQFQEDMMNEIKKEGLEGEVELIGGSVKPFKTICPWAKNPKNYALFMFWRVSNK